MAGFGEQLGELVVGGLGSLAGALLPEHWKRQAKARLADVNPFDIIKGNHDLTRAVRIAWIEAALQVLDAARATRSGPAGCTNCCYRCVDGEVPLRTLNP